jgi:Zn-dependent peptidase ImmA (M78 family)
MAKKATLRRGFKSEANRKAITFRKELGLKSTDKLCGFNLAKHLGVFIYTLLDFKIPESEMHHYDEWSAVTLPNKAGDRIIIHNHSHSPERQQSNLMHELSHIICGHKMRETEFQFDFLLMRDFDEEQEDEANCLGGCLQLPRESLLWALKKGMNKSDISNYYGASVPMVTKRINETGVMRQLSYMKK